MMNPIQQFQNPDAIRILQAVRERDMDVYTLMSITGLDQTKLEAGLKELLDRNLLIVNGATSGPQLLDSYVSVPVRAKGYADIYISGSLSGR